MPAARFQLRLLRPLMCAGASLLGAASGTQSLGQASAATIVERSPFLPANFSPPSERLNPRPSPAAAQRQDYEFRGVYELDGGYQVLISEAKSRSGRWMPVGGSDETIQIQNYDVQSETVKVLINGEPRELQLASIEANPQPVAVARAQTAATLPQRSTAAARATTGPTPVRRTIRPSSTRVAPVTAEVPAAASADDSGTSAAPPPPAWLQELRERAAERREAAAEQQTQ